MLTFTVFIILITLLTLLISWQTTHHIAVYDLIFIFIILYISNPDTNTLILYFLLFIISYCNMLHFKSNMNYTLIWCLILVMICTYLYHVTTNLLCMVVLIELISISLMLIFFLSKPLYKLNILWYLYTTHTCMFFLLTISTFHLYTLQLYDLQDLLWLIRDILGIHILTLLLTLLLLYKLYIFSLILLFEFIYTKINSQCLFFFMTTFTITAIALVHHNLTLIHNTILNSILTINFLSISIISLNFSKITSILITTSNLNLLLFTQVIISKNHTSSINIIVTYFTIYTIALHTWFLIQNTKITVIPYVHADSLEHTSLSYWGTPIQASSLQIAVDYILICTIGGLPITASFFIKLYAIFFTLYDHLNLLLVQQFLYTYIAYTLYLKVTWKTVLINTHTTRANQYLLHHTLNYNHSFTLVVILLFDPIYSIIIHICN